MLKRKIISYLLLLTMLFTVFTATSAVYADDTDSESVDEQPTQVKSTVSYDRAYDIVSALGLIDVSINANMTRGEVTSSILKLIGIDVSYDNLDVKQVFDDVPPTHPYAAQILAAYDLGIVNGVGGGSFEPDEKVTYIQAVKMIVGALGYGITARDDGNLEKYMQTAISLKLTKGIQEPYNTELTGGIYAQLIYNSLEVKNLEVTSSGLIKEYSDKNGDTILSYNDLIKIKDVVYETSVTSLAGRSTVRNGQVRIGDRACNIGDTAADLYLGYYVLAYLSYDEDVDTYPTVVYCEPVAGYNEILTITEKTWSNASLNANYSVTINYLEGRNSRRAVLSPMADIIYNGVNAGDFDITAYTPYNGDVTLIDYDGDDEYDVALIREYKTMYVESISNGSYKVSGQLDGESGTIELDPDNPNYQYRVIYDGDVLEFEDIGVKSLISIAESLDGTYKEVQISEEVVPGTIDELSEDGNVVSITVGGETYDVLPYITKTNIPFKAGDDMNFYIDFRGNVGYYKVNTKVGSSYAYVIGVSQDKGIDGGARLKLLDEDGSINIYDCKDEVIFYDSKETKRVDGVAINGALKPEILYQVIMYKTNTSGLITEILPPDNYIQDPEQGLSRPELLYKDKYGDGLAWGSRLGSTTDPTFPYLHYINYSGDAPSFFFRNGNDESKEDVMLIDAAMPVFYVPYNTAQTEDFRFEVMRPASLKRISTEYPMEVFNLDKNGKLSLALIRYQDDAGIDQWAECHIVDEVTKKLLDDGQEVYNIKGMSSSAYVEYEVDDTIFRTGGETVLPTSLKRGDIVQFAFNSEGQVNYIKKIIDGKDLNKKYCSSEYCADNGSLTYGKVERIEGQAVKVATNYTFDHIRWFGTRGLPCAIYDSAAGKDGLFYTGGIADLEVGDWVLIRAGQAWVTQWYVFKGVND